MTELLTTITSTDGLALEATLDEPGDARAGLVLCHPHPRMGGTMKAPLLLHLRDTLVARRWAVLRFNFRGIGASEGTSGDGIPEIADAAGAVAFLRERQPTWPLAIAGWSFGASVAARYAAQEPAELAACVLIAPAVQPRSEVSAGLPQPSSWPQGLPTLLVCAGRDELVASDDCKRWAEEAGASCEVIEAANHFFWARYDELGEVVAEFLDAEA